jgi:chorismate mutase
MKQTIIQSDLENLRKQIDAIDEHIISLLSIRMDVVQHVGEYKKQHKIEARDEKRWQSLLDALIKKGQEKKLSKEVITNIYTAIHEYSVGKQQKMKL